MPGLLDATLLDYAGMQRPGRALAWLRRMVTLEQLRLVLACLAGDEKRLLALCARVPHAALPTAWWGAREDVDLMRGIYRHGAYVRRLAAVVSVVWGVV